MRVPPFRKLRVFAFDPSLATQLGTAGINVVTLKIPWEEGLIAGPVGEYLSVVDLDDAGQPNLGVDLDEPFLLHEAGLPPSQANRQFHQQMSYAVSMATINRFETALGRRVQWSPRRKKVDGVWSEEFVRRLGVYCNSVEDANAWYDPLEKALYFGFVRSVDRVDGGGVVRTCLSHDIIAHEITHAILDGMHRRYLENTNPDVLAFHEAFADIVALFQHFTYPEVLAHEIGKARGHLETPNLLLGLAKQLGEVVLHGQGALRNALGTVDSTTGKFRLPDPNAMKTELEPHARAGILVGAIFDAFLIIYKSRTDDLLRIATGGSGNMPDRDLHPDLVARLATEANKGASHVLQMCIRALDYLPPVDVTFGEYLRAIITADHDMVPDDDRHYRLAFIEGFERRGIYPDGIESLAEDSLLWRSPQDLVRGGSLEPILNESALHSLQLELNQWRRSSNRKDLFTRSRNLRARLHEWFRERYVAKQGKERGEGEPNQFEDLTGLVLSRSAPKSVTCDAMGLPYFEVHAATPTRRIGPDGELHEDLIVLITQRRKGFFDPRQQERADAGALASDVLQDFWFRGGCTLLINLDDAQPRLLIRKDIQSQSRLERQREYLRGSSSAF